MNVNFGSTYRIPISQPGVNNAKKERLRELTSEYDGLISSSKTGAARVSIENKLDEKFEKKLRGIGYKEYQKFPAEKLSKDEIDLYIRLNQPKGNYTQRGKQKKGMPKRKELYN